MEERKKAPEIFTGKDLDYIKDMFGWNHTAYKVCLDAIDNCEDDRVIKVLNECAKLFKNNMNSILNILEGGKNGK